MKFRTRHLWWLFTPILLIGIVVAFQAYAQARQKHAIEEVERLGGQVLTTHGDPDWLRRLFGKKSLKLFENATVVNLSGTKITDADLTCLKTLKGLERLNLNETEITDKGLEHLEGLTGLKALDLSRTKISGRGLKHLRNLADLQYLYLSDTRTNDGDVHHLYELKNLQHLDVSGTEIGENGVQQLARHLSDLKVKRSRID